MPSTLLAAAIALAALTPTQTAPLSVPDVAGRWRLVTPAPPPNTPSEIIVRGPSRFAEIVLFSSFPSGVIREVLTLDPTRPPAGLDARVVGNALVFTRPAYARSGAAPAAPERQEDWSVDAAGRLRIEITDRWPTGSPIRSEVVYERAVAETRRGVNLLANPDASAGQAAWWTNGDAKVELCDGSPCFVVRNGGEFQQSVLLPPDAPGQYLVTIGSGASERVEASITGRGYISGQFAIAGGGRFVGGMQGQNLRANSPQPNAWVVMSGVSLIPDGAAQVEFHLRQAAARGVPQNGSAARFDDVGVYVFETEPAAREFVARWKGSRE